MPRIYFDKQIFSFLFKQDNPIYQKLYDDLLDNKHLFLYCHSHAHMRDLLNDHSDIKYKELEFMETLVEDNYLSYHALDKKTSCYLAKPLQAYNDQTDESPPTSFENLFTDVDLSFATDEQKEQLAKAQEILRQPIDFSALTNSDTTKVLPPAIQKLLPPMISGMSMLDWMNHFMGTLKQFQEDKTIYKGVRSLTDLHINNGKFTVDYDSIDFNDDLKNSVLKKSFIDYVNSNLNPNGDKKITDYDFFSNAYMTLDILGISKDSSKNIRFTNLLNDALHSYYGAFCDYVVSEDSGFLRKTRAMYRLLGIQVNVLHIDDFIKEFYQLSQTREQDSNTFLKLLSHDIQHAVIINSKPSLQSNRYTTTSKTYHLYLNYFNRLDNIIENNKSYIVLYRHTESYSYFNFYKEYEKITNAAVRVFGTDDHFLEQYDRQKENEQIKKGDWPGRVWDFEGFSISLEWNKGIGTICLIISFKDENPKNL